MGSHKNCLPLKSWQKHGGVPRILNLNTKGVLSICCTNRPRGYKTNSCSTQLNMKFFLLLNVKMPTVVGILTLVSRKNSILGLSEGKKTAEFLDSFILMSI